MEQPSPVSPVLKGRPWVNYLEKKKSAHMPQNMALFGNRFFTDVIK
jgi:hypothetical protein